MQAEACWRQRLSKERLRACRQPSAQTGTLEECTVSCTTSPPNPPFIARHSLCCSPSLTHNRSPQRQSCFLPRLLKNHLSGRETRKCDFLLIATVYQSSRIACPDLPNSGDSDCKKKSFTVLHAGGRNACPRKRAGCSALPSLPESTRHEH